MKNYITHQVLCNPESYTKTMTFIAENMIADDKNGYEFSIKGFDSTVVVHQKFNDDQLAGFKKLNIDPMMPLYRAAIQEFIDILMPIELCINDSKIVNFKDFQQFNNSSAMLKITDIYGNPLLSSMVNFEETSAFVSEWIRELELHCPTSLDDVIVKELKNNQKL